MPHRRRHAEREHGQMVVLFALVLVVILAFAAIVVDLGFLRNNRQILRNTTDAAALAGGTLMPVDGSVAGKAAAVKTLIDSVIQKNSPGLPTSAYTITYRCLVGVAAGQADLTQVTAGVCDPSQSLGRAAVASDFTGAGATRVAACDPGHSPIGDKCNVVVVTGSSTTQYAFGPAVGITSGSTGVVQSASCNGPCGAAVQIPVDVVLIMYRTLSMSNPAIAAIQTGASAVLSVFNPALQRVALGAIGPSTPGLSACPNVSDNTSPLKTKTSPANQVYGVAYGVATNNSSDINYFNYPADLPKWIAVDFTGQDAGSPAVTWNEAYSVNKVTQTGTRIWKAISCFYRYTTGTNLDTPIYMAQQYLNLFGRPGVKKGIILETDGSPQEPQTNSGPHYTCSAANDTAGAARINAGYDPIDIYTIYYSDGSQNCPDSSGTTDASGTHWRGLAPETLLKSMASPDKPGEQHFFLATNTADLISAFGKTAYSLIGGGLHLIQLYPAPVVTAVGPASGPKAGGTSVTITGQYFTVAFSVTFGGAAASFTVTSDTGGGSSPIVPADHFTYN